MELCIALLVGFIGAELVAWLRHRREPTSTAAELRDAFKTHGDTFRTVLGEVHAGHRATNQSLQERLNRVQIERDHYFQVANQYARRLEGPAASAPEPPGVPKDQPQDGALEYDRFTKVAGEKAPPQLDNVEQA